MGLQDHAHHLPTQLSGGEQQRTAIARALVHDPAILIADEPTGNLDPVTSWEIIQLLIQINELGTTVLMATHNQEIVNAMRRRVLALEARAPRARRGRRGLRARVLTDGLPALHRLQRRPRLAGLLAQRDDEPGRHRDRDPDARAAGGAVHRHRRAELRARVHREQGGGDGPAGRRLSSEERDALMRRGGGPAGRGIGRVRVADAGDGAPPGVISRDRARARPGRATRHQALRKPGDQPDRSRRVRRRGRRPGRPRDVERILTKQAEYDTLLGHHQRHPHGRHRRRRAGWR